jgi:hypothetical protein
MGVSEIVYAIIALVAVVAGIITGRSGAAKDLIAAATGLVDPLKQRITELECKVRELLPLVPRVEALERWGAALAEQVKRLGGVPIPFEEFLHAVQRDPLP